MGHLLITIVVSKQFNRALTEVILEIVVHLLHKGTTVGVAKN